jgi:hypothetical protein
MLQVNCGSVLGLLEGGMMPVDVADVLLIFIPSILFSIGKWCVLVDYIAKSFGKCLGCLLRVAILGVLGTAIASGLKAFEFGSLFRVEFGVFWRRIMSVLNITWTTTALALEVPSAFASVMALSASPSTMSASATSCAWATLPLFEGRDIELIIVVGWAHLRNEILVQTNGIVKVIF